MPSIQFHSVSFGYATAGTEVFSDLSLLLDSAWRCALVGRNGRGKTTLLRLIARLEEPTAGTIECPPATLYFPGATPAPDETTSAVLRGRIAPFDEWQHEMVALVERDRPGDLDRYAALEERYLAAGGYEIDAAIHREFAQIGLDETLLDAPFSQLSGGEQTRALIAGLFLQPHLFPLIDEPTNHLDMAGRELLGDYLAGKSGFLLVSHDRHFLDRCCDHVVALNRDDVTTCAGNYSTWHEQTQRILTHEQRTRARLQREAKQLERAAAQRQGWSHDREQDKGAHVDKGYIGHRAAKQMRRAVSLKRRTEQNLAERKALLRNLEKERTLEVATAAASAGALLTINNLCLRIEGRPLIENLSLTLAHGERIAVTGANGCGKTTLFDAISGTHDDYTGTIARPGHVRLARSYQVPRWRSGSPRDHLRGEALDETRFRQILGVMGMEGDLFEHPLETFSQGQLKKVDLARSLMAAPNLLLWDEPTNYVDVYSREQIATAILEYAPTLLFIDHDRHFVEQVATSVIELHRL